MEASNSSKTPSMFPPISQTKQYVPNTQSKTYESKVRNKDSFLPSQIAPAPVLTSSTSLPRERDPQKYGNSREVCCQLFALLTEQCASSYRRGFKLENIERPIPKKKRILQRGGSTHRSMLTRRGSGMSK